MAYKWWWWSVGGVGRWLGWWSVVVNGGGLGWKGRPEVGGCEEERGSTGLDQGGARLCCGGGVLVVATSGGDRGDVRTMVVVQFGQAGGQGTG